MSIRIAIPTDFSEGAEKAANYAMDLFRTQACRFYLVHTYTPSFFRADYLLHSPGQIGLGDYYKQKVLDQLEAFKHRLMAQSNPDLHEFIVHAAFDNLDAELNEMALKEKLDLIAMGTQGATGAKEVLFGSHAVQVLHKARIPVLVIPKGAGVEALNDVLFPTDYKVNFKKIKLQILKDVLIRKNSKLHVLHTFTLGDDAPQRKKNREALEKIMGNILLEWHDRPEQPIVSAINNFADEVPVQLLVMVRNTHSMLENLMVTPLIHKIGFHTQIPFLVIPPA
ncbi:MAG: hypothetical protein RLZZ241_1113 [Bacteroidota bacterium]|jgi:nucleotide-binding universal stress UspA family protein